LRNKNVSLLVGNDVVDLMDAEARPEQLHPRFDERVFTAAERDRIATGGCPHQTRWALWAAKESAYKVAKKLDSRTRFSPACFVAELERDGTGVIRHRDKNYTVAIVQSKQYVHAIAVGFADHNSSIWLLKIRPERSTSLRCQTWRVEDRAAQSSFVYSEARAVRGEPKDIAGPAVRKLAKKVIGDIAGVDPQELEIAAEGRLPRVWRKGSELPVDLSLSHHGRFVALAFSYSIGIR